MPMTPCFQFARNAIDSTQVLVKVGGETIRCVIGETNHFVLVVEREQWRNRAKGLSQQSSMLSFAFSTAVVSAQSRAAAPHKSMRALRAYVVDVASNFSMARWLISRSNLGLRVIRRPDAESALTR